VDSKDSAKRPLVEVCLNHRGPDRPSCIASGSRELLNELKVSLGENAITKPSICMGYCARAITCRVTLDGTEPIVLVESDAQKVLNTLETAN
jgi:hypothetical protein